MAERSRSSEGKEGDGGTDTQCPSQTCLSDTTVMFLSLPSRKHVCEDDQIFPARNSIFLGLTRHEPDQDMVSPIT